MSKPTYGEMRTRAERILDEEIKQRVVDGLEVLRKIHGPGFADFIDCETLDLRSVTTCVLGQMYGGDYDEGVAMLLLADTGKEGWATGNEWAVAHGFCAHTVNNDDHEWDDLDEAWHAVFCDKEAIPGGAS